MPFFHYSQNNSGGSFDFDIPNGITHHVVVEAVDWLHANSRAETIGLYWDGCDRSIDCSCCGDRWYAQYENDGDVEPMVYGDIPLNPSADGSLSIWEPNGDEVAVHYLDGRIEIINLKKPSA